MKFNTMIPELTVLDIHRTKDFYIKQLGFTLEYERKEDCFIFLSYHESQFMFEQLHDAGWNTSELEYPFGRGINFSISTPDVYDLYQKVLACNIKPYRKLKEVAYRCDDTEILEVQFLIQDPDGYLLRFTN